MNERTVVVTGGSRGIGLEICRRLLAANYRVLAVARGATADLDSLGAQHDALEFVAADLSTPDGLQRVCGVLRRSATLYGLVNNAALAVARLHVTTDERSIAAMLALNVQTPIVLSQAAVKSMSRRRSGRIVNISSIAARRSFRGLATYTATKAAMEGFSRVLALEVGRWSITVNCVAPGFIQTDMNANLSPETRSRIAARNVLPQAPNGDLTGATVQFLLSPDAAAITGQVIGVDSGASV